MLIPNSRMTAVRAPRGTGELFVVIELPIARNWALLVNHKRGKAFRLRTAPALFRFGFCANFISRHSHTCRAIAGRRVSPPAEPHHLGRRHHALGGVSAT